MSNPLAVVSIERPTHLVEPAGEFGVITGSGKMCKFSERGNLVVLIEPFKKSEDAYRSIGIQTWFPKTVSKSDRADRNGSQLRVGAMCGVYCAGALPRRYGYVMGGHARRFGMGVDLGGAAVCPNLGRVL